MVKISHFHTLLRRFSTSWIRVLIVWLILEYLANGDSVDNVLAAYPSLTQEDISACLAYASKAARERIIPIEVSSRAL